MSKRKKEYAVDVLKREIEERKKKLKPCPFCNGKAEVYDFPPDYAVCCDSNQIVKCASFCIDQMRED